MAKNKQLKQAASKASKINVSAHSRSNSKKGVKAHTRSASPKEQSSSIARELLSNPFSKAPKELYEKDSQPIEVPNNPFGEAPKDMYKKNDREAPHSGDWVRTDQNQQGYISSLDRKNGTARVSTHEGKSFVTQIKNLSIEVFKFGKNEHASSEQQRRLDACDRGGWQRYTHNSW